MRRLRPVAPLLLAAIWLLALTAPARAAGPPPPEVEAVKLPSHDGVKLDGWLIRPKDVPAGKKLPVVLWSSPYFGQCNYSSAPPSCSYATGDDPELYDNSGISEAVPINFLLEHGYAVAVFSVRGTGNSGGCFEWFGTREQKDQAFLVEWLAARPWSNGNVGMMGLSYHGTTPWEAAIQNPPHLKTIVPAGIISDAYLFSHTPQGATFGTIGVFDNNFVVRTSLSPPIKGSPEHGTIEHVPVVPERLCPDLAKFITEDTTGTLTDVRDKAFWDERRLIDRFPGIQTSVLLVDGFQDHYLSGHQMQANEVWDRLPNAPKRMLVGQWGHQFPNFNTFNQNWKMADWNDRVLAWLDYWLKGIGDAAPREGLVDYQEGRFEDQDAPFESKLPGPAPQWHASSAWPPAEVRDEVLYLTEGKLSPTGGGASSRFRSSPHLFSTEDPEELLCAQAQPGTPAVSFTSEPVRRRTLVAGNPFAYMKLTSDQPGGQVAVHLFDVAPEFRCDGSDNVKGAKYWAAGTADLRYHQGNFTGQSFPVGTPTHVRIDIVDLAEVLEPGHRLVAVISRGDPIDRNSQPYFPGIEVHADGGPQASHVVVPVADGSLGGAAPTLGYPPRPFLPPASPRSGATGPPAAAGRGPQRAGKGAVRGGYENERTVGISRRALRLSRRGAAAMWLSCPSSARKGCSGIVRLATAKAVSARTLRRLGLRTRRASRLRLGAGRFRLPAGARRLVRVRLTRRGRRLVALRRSVRIRATATARGLPRSTQTLTLSRRAR